MAEIFTVQSNSRPVLSVFQFLSIVGQLKRTKRTGWVNHHVNLPESVSDHMYRMSICSFLIKSDDIDRTKLMKLAIVHDLAEATVGDITPFDGVTKEDKHRLEMEGLTSMLAELHDDDVSHEIMELFLEYENKSSPESILVHEIDKFEMLFQAFEYERDQEIDLTSFFVSTSISSQSEVSKWYSELIHHRQACKAKYPSPSLAGIATNSTDDLASNVQAGSRDETTSCQLETCWIPVK